MAGRASDTVGTARRGRAIVVKELESRGATVREVKEGQLQLLEVASRRAPKPIWVRVKTRRSGTWQPSVSDGKTDPQTPKTPTFWIFVDLTQSPEEFFVVPDADIRREIYGGHQRYLKRHGGRRAVNNASNHHSLAADRIQEWRGRWDLLGLEQDGTKPT